MGGAAGILKSHGFHAGVSEGQIWEDSQNRKEIQRWNKGPGMGCGARMRDEEGAISCTHYLVIRPKF